MNLFSSPRLIIKLSIIVFTAIAVFLIFIPPQIGIANSGDFGRIMDIFKLYYVPNYSNFTHFYDIFTTNRPFDAPSYGGYVATTSIFLSIAYIINFVLTIFSDNQYFYIYCLSSLYLAVYIVGFYILLNLVSKKLSNIIFISLFSVIGIIFFSDSLFVEYFNSFFQEPSFIVCFLLYIAAFLYYKNFILDLILLSLVIFSKEQNIIYVLLFIPLFIKYRPSTSKLLMCAITILPIIFVYTNINTYSAVMNKSDGVFSGLLHDSNQREAVQILTTIGLNPEYAVFANKDYWTNVGELTNNPANIQLFRQMLQDTSQLNMLKGYLYYPNKLITNYIKQLDIATSEGPFAPNLGNYKTNTSSKYRVTAFSYYSKFILKHIFWIISINVLLWIVIMSKYQINKPFENNLISTLNVLALLLPIVNFLGAGYAEVTKHFLELYFTETILLYLQLIFCVKRYSHENINHKN